MIEILEVEEMTPFHQSTSNLIKSKINFHSSNLL